MTNVMEPILRMRIVPAPSVERAEDAVPLAEALLQGGLGIMEITLRTAAAADAIREVARKLPEMLVGAGTVLSADQLARAADAGARFAVAPGLNEQLLEKAADMGLLFIPGTMTPTEIDRAIAAGCKLLKFFPAETAGGVKALKALAGPFSHTGVKFLPTGGIVAANARSYLDLPIVAAVGGSWMTPNELIRAKKWPEIAGLAREALALVPRS